MKRTIATMTLNGQYRVTHDDSQKTNPYRLTKTWYELTEHGCRKRTKQITRYADLGSCMYYLSQIALANNQY